MNADPGHASTLPRLELPALQLRRLAYFAVVAEELHFGRAADRLHMAQPPLSQQIRRLEDELGLSLLDRSTRRVALTAAGEFVLEAARPVLAAATVAERAITEYRDGEQGSLRIGFVDSAAYQVLPEFLHEHRTRWPEVAYELRSLSSDEQVAALRSGEIDLGICRTAAMAAEMRTTRIMLEPLCLAVGANHRLAENRTTSLSQIAGEPMIGFDRRVSPTLHAELVALFDRVDVRYDPIIEATEYATILGLVASGEGSAVVPAGVRSLQPPNLRYLDFRDDSARLELLLMSRPEPSAGTVILDNAYALAAELFA